MAKRLPKDEVLKDLFLACEKECDDEMKEIRKAQDMSLDQYLCKMDFSRKRDWQSKMYVPIGKPAIKKATRMIKRALIDAETYIDYNTPSGNEERKKQCDRSRRIVKAHLDKDHFLDKFGDAVESGFSLCLMVLKFFVSGVTDHWTIDSKEEDRVSNTLPRLRVKLINPYNFKFTMDRSIHIEHEWIKLPDLVKLSDKNNGPFRNITVQKMIAEDYGRRGLDKDNEDRLNELGIKETDNKFRKNCLVSHYWGPILDENGGILMENAHFVIGNRKYILMRPKLNPYWHEKPPYVYDSPLPVLFRHVGKSLIEDVAALESEIVKTVNLQADNLKWINLGINEVDEMALSEAGKAELTELYPGRFIRKRSGYEKPAFTHHEIGTSPEKSIPFLHELKQFHDRDTLVTDYVSSLPTQTPDTLGEYQGKRASGVQDFASIARDIERRFLTRCADMARDLIIQYLSDFNQYPEIRQIFEGEQEVLSNLNDVQRKAMVVTDLDIVGRGISIFFDRQEQLNKLGVYVKMLNAMPEEAQLWVVWPEALMRINDAFAFDRREALVRTADQVKQLVANRQQAQQAQMQQAMKLKFMEWQHETQEWMLDFKAKMAKLQQEMIENAKDREQELLLKLIEGIEKKDELRAKGADTRRGKTK